MLCFPGYCNSFDNCQIFKIRSFVFILFLWQNYLYILFCIHSIVFLFLKRQKEVVKLQFYKTRSAPKSKRQKGKLCKFLSLLGSTGKKSALSL